MRNPNLPSSADNQSLTYEQRQRLELVVETLTTVFSSDKPVEIKTPATIFAIDILASTPIENPPSDQT